MGGGPNHTLACRSDPMSDFDTTIKQLEPQNKPVAAFLNFVKIVVTQRG